MSVIIHIILFAANGIFKLSQNTDFRICILKCYTLPLFLYNQTYNFRHDMHNDIGHNQKDNWSRISQQPYASDKLRMIRLKVPICHYPDIGGNVSDKIGFDGTPVQVEHPFHEIQSDGRNVVVTQVTSNDSHCQI